jgi:HEAT repeat protein
MIPILALLAALAAAAPLTAHGGTYRAPGDAVPGLGGGSGTAAAGGNAPGSPGAGAASGTTGAGAGPSAAGPGAGPGPAAGGISGRGPAGTPVGEDLTRWSYFWEFRKDSFLRLRDRVHDTGTVKNSDSFFMGAGARAGIDTLRPTEAQVRGEILPALHRALESTGQRDITSSCLVALAKVGLEDRYFELLPTLRARLTSHDQEIRETAALAMGISERSAAIVDLGALLHDDARGRALCERREVDDRTRAFAAYGLGLVAHASRSAAVKTIVHDILARVLDDDTIPGMDIQVAALNAIGLLRPETATDGGAALQRRALGTLARFFDADLGVGRQLVQAHVPTAAAALLAGSDEPELRTAWMRRLVRELRPEQAEEPLRRRNLALAQSAALALGALAGPHEVGAPDAWVSAALIDTFENGVDLQAGYFALTALGAIGGAANVDRLLETVESGTKSLQRPWAALALGMHEHQRLVAAGAAGRSDPAITAAIRAQLDEVKNPDSLAAFAIALGLCRDGSAAPRLLELLAAHRHQDEFAGYLCIALALIDERSAVDPIREIVRTSARRPQLLLQAAVALGRLGDKTAALLLMDQMVSSEQNLAVLASLAFAVGQIGDRRTVAPLMRMVEDEGLSDLARAFAVVAIGGVGDKEDEPWNAKIGRLVNYRAAVETLFNQVSGILDIL